MTDAGRAASDAAGGLVESWRRLNTEQRVAATGALLLVVSTFGPFSFVEAAEALTGLAVLVLLRQRADRKRFHLPFGDGTVILAAALWSALLIAIRLFDRPLGQSILALGCAAILAAAGLRERAKRPADDVPEPPRPSTREPAVRLAAGERVPDEPTRRLSAEGPAVDLPAAGESAHPPAEEPTRRLPAEDPTMRLGEDDPVQLELEEPNDPSDARDRR